MELTDEELEQLKKNPNLAKELDLDTKVDDYEVDDAGGVNELIVFEVDEGGTTIKEVNMKQGDNNA